jgi:acetyl esterase/lipase
VALNNGGGAVAVAPSLLFWRSNSKLTASNGTVHFLFRNIVSRTFQIAVALLLAMRLFTTYVLLGCAVTVIDAASKSTHEVFDWKLANASVELSALAYCDDARGSVKVGGSNIEGFEISSMILGTKGFVGTLPSMGAIFVTYAGSGTFLDWVEDADSHLVQFKGCDKCKVHQGFNLVERIGFPLMEFAVGVLKMRHPHYRVVVTGHSKGAGIATLAAMDLVEAGVKDVSLVTFGSPRVGNAEFAEYASRKLSHHYRLTHHTDVVPSVPTRSQGYLHLSGEWYEHPDMQVRLCDGYEDASCSAQWSRLLHIRSSRSEAADTQLGDDGLDQREEDEVAYFLHRLGAMKQSEWDHLHYLSRVVRCPAPTDSAHNTTGEPGSAPLLRGSLVTVRDSADTAEGHARAVRDAVNEQRKLMGFAAWGMAAVLVLFMCTIYTVLKEARRRAAAFAESGQSTAQCSANRSAEMTPLLVGCRPPHTRLGTQLNV